MAGLEGLLAGRVLGGRYLIEEVIGRGGMGAVYRALDERLGRRVAVKVITLLGGDREAVERMRARFHREARAAAALPHHPNVVPVYDYGTDEALGLDYIVMELLRGQDLATRLARSNPPPLSTALRILLQAVRGVAVGHRSGLIHRDIKPGNIYLTQGDEREVQVRVVDFGIAKLVDDEDSANQLTQDGRVPHSPAFASPEQLRGLTRLTPASDVFSLGAVGYLLLTGERPFTDADRNRMSLGMPVPPPPMRTSHPAIPAGVEVVVRKALSFDPADRYPDAGAMLEALEEAIRSIASSPLEPYAGVHFTPPADAAAAESAERQDAADDETRLLEPDLAVLPDEDDRTRVLEPEDDRTLLGPLPPRPMPGGESRASGTTPPSAGRAFPSRSPRTERKSRMGVVVWLIVLLALAGVGYWAYLEVESGDEVADIPPAPEPIQGIGEPVGAEQPEQPSPAHAAVLNLEGNRLFDRRQFDSAAVNYRMAVQIEPDHAHYRRNLALALLYLGQPEEAITHLRRALALDPTMEIAQYDYARALLAVGDTSQALQEFSTFANRVATASDQQLAAAYLSARNTIARIERSRARERAEEGADTSDDQQTLPVPDTVAPVVPSGPLN